MSKAAKTNLNLFIICILLFLVAWFQPGLYKEHIVYFTDLKADEIHTIVIQRKGLEQIKLIKKEGEWFVVEPEHAKANILRVDTITALAEKRSYSQLHVKDKDLERYKLTRPKVIIWLNNEQFIIGGKHPVKELRYAMKVDKTLQSETKLVHLIDDKVFYQLRTNLDSFIQKMP